MNEALDCQQWIKSDLKLMCLKSILKIDVAQILDIAKQSMLSVPKPKTTFRTEIILESMSTIYSYCNNNFSFELL